MITFVGRFTLGALFPAIGTLQASLLATVNGALAAISADLPQIDAQLPSVQAEFDGIDASIKALAAAIALGPAGIVAGAVSFIGSGQMLAGLQLAGPQLLVSLQARLGSLTADLGKVSLKLGGLTTIKLGMEARLVPLRAALALAQSFGSLLIKGGARLYVYTGPLGNIGVDLDAHINGGGTDGMSLAIPVWVPIIVTDDAGTQAALQQLIAA